MNTQASSEEKEPPKCQLLLLPFLLLMGAKVKRKKLKGANRRRDEAESVRDYAVGISSILNENSTGMKVSGDYEKCKLLFLL